MRLDDLTRCIVFGMAATIATIGALLPHSSPDWMHYVSGGLAAACIIVGFAIRDTDD